MTRDHVIAAILFVITVIFTLLILALFDRDASSKVPYDCADPTERERVRQLALDAVDDGLKSAMVHLFDIWQREPATQQPQRAQVGTTNAINAHSRARKLVLAWNPDPC